MAATATIRIDGSMLAEMIADYTESVAKAFEDMVPEQSFTGEEVAEVMRGCAEKWRSDPTIKERLEL